MKKNSIKNLFVGIVLIFITVILLPSAICANTVLLEDDEEIICTYVDMDNIDINEEIVEENSFKKVELDNETNQSISKIGLGLLGVSFCTLIGKGVFELRSK